RRPFLSSWIGFIESRDDPEIARCCHEPAKGSPSPLNGERAGVRGEAVRLRFGSTEKARDGGDAADAENIRRPKPCAHSTNVGLFSNVNACSGVFDFSRRGQASLGLGPSNVAEMG